MKLVLFRTLVTHYPPTSPGSLLLFFVSMTLSAVLYSLLQTSLPSLKEDWVKASLENGWVLTHGCTKALRMGCRERNLCGNEV